MDYFMTKKYILASLQEAQECLDKLLSNTENLNQLQKMVDIIVKCYKNNGMILSCGNGGSACDSMHFAEELTGSFRKIRKGLPAISLTDSSHITCVGNDFGFDQIFSRGVESYGQKGSALIALSTSGNSANIIEAVKVAKEKEMFVLLFLGKQGGILNGQGDAQIIAPGKHSDRIQEIHMTCLHIIIEIIERNLFPQNYVE